jgi:hypothetical protein
MHKQYLFIYLFVLVRQVKETEKEVITDILGG